MRKVAYAPINYGYSQCYASSNSSLFLINSKISNSLILDHKNKMPVYLKVENRNGEVERNLPKAENTIYNIPPLGDRGLLFLQHRRLRV